MRAARFSGTGPARFSGTHTGRLQIPIRLLGTEIDEHQLRRARIACYSSGCLRELPLEWRDYAFEPRGGEFCVKSEFRENMEFRRQDVRREMPEERFHLILCRYLAFTYFAKEVQQRLAAQLYERLAPGGFVVLGKHESWPAEAPLVTETQRGLRIYCEATRTRTPSGQGGSTKTLADTPFATR